MGIDYWREQGPGPLQEREGQWTMSRDELTRRVHAAIDRRAEEIVAIGEQIRRTPELGFKEERTARLVEETFRRLNLPARTGLAFTGVRAEARGRAGDGPTFGLIGELDGLVVAGHPERDPTSGAAHACGHNAQIAAMLAQLPRAPTANRPIPAVGAV
jgi:metal-dependent amidase/aminoacylase/carboxypeptidase family protein